MSSVVILRSCGAAEVVFDEHGQAREGFCRDKEGRTKSSDMMRMPYFANE